MHNLTFCRTTSPTTTLSSTTTEFDSITEVCHKTEVSAWLSNRQVERSVSLAFYVEAFLLTSNPQTDVATATETL